MNRSNNKFDLLNHMNRLKELLVFFQELFTTIDKTSIEVININFSSFCKII